MFYLEIYSIVQEGFTGPSFKLLESASDFQMVLLLALTSLKRIVNLQASLVSPSIMDFALGLVKV